MNHRIRAIAARWRFAALIAVVLTAVGAPGAAQAQFSTPGCIYYGGYPWQTNGCLEAGDLNAAIANAMDAAANLGTGAAGTVFAAPPGASGAGTYRRLVASDIPQLDASDISGLGSLATQSASAVAFTGGTVDGTSVGAKTPSSGAFTILSAAQYAQLVAQSSAPASCAAPIAGAMAITALYHTCVCTGSAWIDQASGNACSW